MGAIETASKFLIDTSFDIPSTVHLEVSPTKLHDTGSRDFDRIAAD